MGLRGIVLATGQSKHPAKKSHATSFSRAWESMALAVKLLDSMAQKKNATGIPVRIKNEGNTLRTPDTSSPPPPSDESLVIRVAGGNSVALEALYDRYASAVFGFSLRIIGDQAIAEDVVQETFWRVWQNAATYQTHLGTFTSWLFRIARNLAIDAYRRRNVHLPIINDVEEKEPVLDQTPDPNADVATQTQAILRNRQVRQALLSLPISQRQVIELAYFHGMTRQEIAEVTGEALGTINTRARLALQKLRAALNKEEFEG